MNIGYFCLFVLIFYCSLFDYVSSLRCISNACESPEVLAKCKPLPKECPKGFVLKPAGLCRCCKTCKRIIYENDDCAPETPIAGAISDKVVCAEGLQCIESVCQKEPDLHIIVT